MSNNLIQPSFAAGELSPALYSRVDLAKYKVGAATMRNFFVDYRGGASTRAGTRYVATSGTPGTGLPPRLVRFQFSILQTYVIEFGAGYIAFYSQGAQITLSGSPYTISSPYALADLPLLKFTQSDDVLTICHPSYAPMQLNRYADTNWSLTAISFGAQQTPPVAGTVTPTHSTETAATGDAGTTVYNYQVTAVSASGEESVPSAPFGNTTGSRIMSVDGMVYQTVTWTPPVTGAAPASYNVYRQGEVPNGSAPAGALFGLIGSTTAQAFTDRNGVPDFSTAAPSCTNPFAPGQIASVNVIAGGSGLSSAVLTINTSTGSGFVGNGVISGGALAYVEVVNPGQNYAPTDTVSVNAGGAASGSVTFPAGPSVGDTITLNGVTWTCVSGLPAAYQFQHFSSAQKTLTLLANALNISGNSSINVAAYAVTQGTSGTTYVPGFGWVSGLGAIDFILSVVYRTSGTAGNSYTLSATGNGVCSGSTLTGGSGASTNPSCSLTVGALSGTYPGCTSYFLQRQWFAASTNLPDTVWASQPGSFTNFDVSFPVTPSNAITETLLSAQVNAIRALVPMPSGMIVLSGGGAWLISGGGVGPGGIPAAITPSDVTAQPQASAGACDVAPLVVNSDILFVQDKGSIVRDLSYNFYVNIYTGTDLTVLSNHLFSGRQIREWAYAEEPFKVVWAVQDNGGLLCLTYLKEQEVYGWSRHDTNGLFQSVATIGEGQVDATYFVVKRLLGGSWVYTIERLADRANVDGNPVMGIPANVENSWAVDCGLALPQPAPAANLSPGVGANVVGASVSIYADASVFSGGNVGAVIRSGGGKATVTGYTDAQHLVATVTVPFPTMPNDPGKTPLPSASGAWTITQPVTVISGLAYLNGMTVSILADGSVMPQQVVSGGQITLQTAASSVLVGLPFTAQLQTLYLDTGEPTIQGKRKKINAASVRVKDSRGVQIGRAATSCRYVKEWNSNVPLGSALPLFTGDQRVVLDPVYDTGGQFWMQVTDPVPATILGVMPEVALGDG